MYHTSLIFCQAVFPNKSAIYLPRTQRWLDVVCLLMFLMPVLVVLVVMGVVGIVIVVFVVVMIRVIMLRSIVHGIEGTPVRLVKRLA